MKFLLSLLLLAAAAPTPRAETFCVVAYNVENLFDVDGRAAYDDYQPEEYTREHFLTKLNAITEVMQRFNRGRGPDVILFQEIEADQTPEKWEGDPVKFLTAHTGVTVEELLREKWQDKLAGVPAQVWLFKRLADAGMQDYFMAVGDGGKGADHRSVVVNVTFSRFPIRSIQLHPSPQARPTLETVLDVVGHPLHVFNNHWKSGASNPEFEPVRMENARVVRERIDRILRKHPKADIIVGGDLNSHYNHGSRTPAMMENGIETVLGSQGDELAIRRRKGPDLYNLWFELPEEERASDFYRGEWGTLMHLIVSRGLYDNRGIQYIDNSFRRTQVSGFNADPVTGIPIRWTFAGDGGGYSDHFPIFAWFRVAEGEKPEKWIELDQPSRDSTGPAKPVRLDFAAVDLSRAPDAAELAGKEPLQSGAHFGKTLKVDGTVSGEYPFRVTVGGEEFQIWTFDPELRQRIYNSHTVGDSIRFYGELSQHHGQWQFVIHDASWIGKITNPSAARSRGR